MHHQDAMVPSVFPDGRSQVEALAAFKRDCSENDAIAELLRGALRPFLLPPLLDVGAGSGEIASRGFPDLEAVLLDLDPHESTIRNHKRVVDDFMEMDFGPARFNTLLFCHSLYYLTFDVERLRKQLGATGSRLALFIVNEPKGMLWKLALKLREVAPSSYPAFYHCVPGLKMSLISQFTAQLRCRDYETLARHVVGVLLHMPFTESMLAAATSCLKSTLNAPTLEIDEAVYCCELRR